MKGYVTCLTVQNYGAPTGRCMACSKHVLRKLALRKAFAWHHAL